MALIYKQTLHIVSYNSISHDIAVKIFIKVFFYLKIIFNLFQAENISILKHSILWTLILYKFQYKDYYLIKLSFPFPLCICIKTIHAERKYKTGRWIIFKHQPNNSNVRKVANKNITKLITTMKLVVYFKHNFWSLYCTCVRTKYN